MNRKNAIQSVLYIIAVFVVVGLLTWQSEQNDRLEETLHEQQETLSVATTALQQTEIKLEDAQANASELLAKATDLESKVDELQGNVSALTTKTEELEAANQQLKKEKQELQGAYDTLKKNKAIAAAKAKQQSSSQSASTDAGKNQGDVAVSRSNNQTATKTFYVEASAYTAYCAGCSGKTRTGIDLRANPNLKVIAVDPRIIPLGSKVWVEGYGYAIAGDTGGAIKGYKIDIFMPSKSDAYKWGRKKVQIKVF